MAGESLEIQRILDDKDAMAVEISTEWDRLNLGRSEWALRVAETKQYVYATSTRETSNSASWNHSTNIPKLTNVYDILKANYVEGLLPNRNWLQIEGEDAESVEAEKRNKIESYLNTKHRLIKLRKIINQLVDDWIITGNCFAEVYYTRETSFDHLKGVDVPGYEGPMIRRIAPDDIVFNPIASDFKHTPKIIRSLLSFGELARDIEENPDQGWKKDVLTKMSETRAQLSGFKSEDIHKATQLRLDGFGSFEEYINSGMVEVLELYGDIYDHTNQVLLKNYVVTVVDRRFVIRQEPLNTWTGRPHIYHGAWRTRPDNLWGMGPLDGLVGMQYLINHLENARADAFDEMLFGDLIIKGDVDIKVGENNSTEYHVTENGDVGRLAPDATVLNADFQIDRKEQQIEQYAGAPREAAGFRTPGEKTKFEVAQLASAGSRIFQNKMTDFDQGILEEIVNAEIEVAKVNLSTRDKVRIEDDVTGVKEFIEITKEDLFFNGRIIPIGSRHFARKNQLAIDLQQLTQAMAQDPELQQHFPSLKLANLWQELLDMDDKNIVEKNGRIPERMEAAADVKAATSIVNEREEAGISELES